MRTMKKSLTVFLAFLALVAFSLGIVTAFTPNVQAEIVEAPNGTQTTVAEKVESLESFRVVGTAVRTVEPWGMRFITVISDSDLALLPDNAEFGTLIIPTDKLVGALDLSNELVAKAQAKVGYDGAEVPVGHKGYTGVIVGDTTSTAFPESDYDRDYSAVGYVTYTYGDGKVDTIYTQVKSTSLVTIADKALNDPDSDLAGDEDLSSIVNNVMSKVSIGVENYALKTGEKTDIVTEGMPNSKVEVAALDNEYVGFDAETGKVYGKKVGKTTLTFEVVSTGATCSTEEITVSAIDAGKVDRVEFLQDDSAIDFSEVATNDTLIASALSADSVTLSAGTVASVADNKIVLAKPATDHDALYGGDKAMTLTAVKGDIEYTINFTTDIADYIVDNKTDLENVNAITDGTADDYIWQGYVMLGANIVYDGDFSDYAIAPFSYSNMDFGLAAKDPYNKGFKGVFDGNGHYIQGAAVGRAEAEGITKKVTGFFGQLANGAVVKNVAFVDAWLRAVNANDYHGYLAHRMAAATIDNVLVVGAVIYTASKVEANLLTGYSGTAAFTVSNSVFQNTGANIKTYEYEASYTSKAIHVSANATYTNVYAHSMAASQTSFTGNGATTGYWSKDALWTRLSLDSGFDARFWSYQRPTYDGKYIFNNIEFLCFNDCASKVFVRG